MPLAKIISCQMPAFRPLSISNPPRQSLAQIAISLLDHARAENERGFAADDRIYLLDAAEKAWNAVCHAVDHLMITHQRTPAVGRDAHATRAEFLDEIGRHDLALRYSHFADRLQGMIFYEGRVPRTKTEMERLLGEVGAFVGGAAEGS